jgi:hypothetical protein
MQGKKPSPALVVSIIALVVAMSGTAVAAKMLVTSSSQIKNGTIRGWDIKNGTITKSKLAKSTLATLTGSSTATTDPTGTQAIEVHRLTGPDVADGGTQEVAKLALQPGVYAVFAKATITPFVSDDGLLDTLGKDDKTRSAECNLDVNGAGDFATAPIVSPGSTNPATLNLQTTRSIDGPGTAVLTCKTAPQVHWQGSNASIIALKVGSANRTEAGK